MNDTDCDHAYVLVDTREEWVGSVNQGGVEWGEYETVYEYRCERCGDTKKEHSGSTGMRQDGIV